MIKKPKYCNSMRCSSNNNNYNNIRKCTPNSWTRLIYYFIFVILIPGCTTQPDAPIIERKENLYYGQGQVTRVDKAMHEKTAEIQQKIIDHNQNISEDNEIKTEAEPHANNSEDHIASATDPSVPPSQRYNYDEAASSQNKRNITTEDKDLHNAITASTSSSSPSTITDSSHINSTTTNSNNSNNNVIQPEHPVKTDPISNNPLKPEEIEKLSISIENKNADKNKTQQLLDNNAIINKSKPNTLDSMLAESGLKDNKSLNNSSITPQDATSKASLSAPSTPTQQSVSPSGSPSSLDNIKNAHPMQLDSSYALATPLNSSKFIWPIPAGKVLHHIKQQRPEFQEGITIEAALNASVHAARDGKVIFSSSNHQKYGGILILQHDNGYLTAYAHLGKILVYKGDIISQNEVIAKVGKTGNISGDKPQLFFSIRKDKIIINPEDANGE